MKCYIWAIIEDGGWDWLKRCLRDRKPRTAYGYNIRRFPQKSDVLIFYSNKRLHGTISVTEGGREVTSRDTRNDPDLKEWKYVMFLDGRTVRMFHKPVPVKEVANHIGKLMGKTGKSLHTTCINDPEISVDECKKIVELGYYDILKEFFPI